ncbi:MAG: glycosyltransferase [Candidatus Rifleibacteriota bacterium]
MFFKKKKVLSVIIPVFNERPFIRECVLKVVESTRQLGLDYEIIIVDDGSKDGTLEELQLLKNEIAAVKIFVQPQNMGKGAALRRGIFEANGEFMLFQDADLEYNPDDIGELLKPLIDGRADVVYGSRFTISPARKILNFHHQAGNQFLTLISNLATGLNLTDMETGYKAFRADILKTVPLRSDRFGIEPEITAKIAKRHCTIYEVPISYNGRSYGEGKKITWRDGFAALYTIAKYWLIDDCYNREQIAETYDDLERTHHAQEQLILRLLPYFGDRLLEIGSGIGSISRILPIREKVTLSDWRPECLEFLNKGFSGKERIEVEELDIHAQTVPTKFHNRYDSLLLMHHLQSAENEERVLHNACSLLQNKGRLIVTLPGQGGDIGPYERQLGYQRRYELESVRQLLEKNGFKLLHHFSANFPALLIWKNVIRKNQLSALPLTWAKVSDSLVRHAAFFEKYFRLDGLTLVVIAEKTNG